MNKKILEWLESDKKLEISYQEFLNKKQIKKEDKNTGLVESRINKAESNLNFSHEVLEKIPKNKDWAIISYYYATYHAALALIAKKGYSSKSHFATICLLIKYYYKNGLEKEDIENIHSLSKESISEFEEMKDKREEASYGISVSFEEALIKDIQKKAINFVNKSKEILEER